MRIIDCFMMLDELDMLEFRLRLLEGLVDCSVIIESNLTHSGKEKPFHFEEARERFAWIKDKIVYLKFQVAVPAEPEALPDINPASPFIRDLTLPYIWRERAQRDVLKCAINLFNDTDIVLLSDIDEIPTRELLETLKDGTAGYGFPFVCEQEHFHYSLAWKSPKTWYGTVVTNLENLKQKTPQDHRDMFHTALYNSYTPGVDPCPGFVRKNAGWHLSFFQSVGGIQHKIRSYSHQELNKPQFLDPCNITQAMQNGTDMFGLGIKFSKSADELPEYFSRLVPSFPQLFSTESN